MAIPGVRSTRTVTFPEASLADERVAAVLVNRDESGSLHAYVAHVPGHEGPDPEIVAALVQSVEIRNLPERN